MERKAVFKELLKVTLMDLLLKRVLTMAAQPPVMEPAQHEIRLTRGPYFV